MNDTKENEMSTIAMRLSRISYPRANVWAMVLLVAVFLSFGIWAQAAQLPVQETVETFTSSGGNHWLAALCTSIGI